MPASGDYKIKTYMVNPDDPGDDPGDAPEPQLTLESVAEQMEAMLGSSREDFSANYSSIVDVLQQSDAPVPLIQKWALEQGGVAEASVKYLLQMMKEYPEDYQDLVIEFILNAIKEAQSTRPDTDVPDDEMGGAEEQPPASPFEDSVMDRIEEDKDVPAAFAGQTWGDVFETIDKSSKPNEYTRLWKVWHDGNVEAALQQSGVMEAIENGQVQSRAVQLAIDRLILAPMRESVGKTSSEFWFPNLSTAMKLKFERLQVRLRVGPEFAKIPEWAKILLKAYKDGRGGSSPTIPGVTPIHEAIVLYRMDAPPIERQQVMLFAGIHQVMAEGSENSDPKTLIDKIFVNTFPEYKRTTDLINTKFRNANLPPATIKDWVGMWPGIGVKFKNRHKLEAIGTKILGRTFKVPAWASDLLDTPEFRAYYNRVTGGGSLKIRGYDEEEEEEEDEGGGGGEEEEEEEEGGESDQKEEEKEAEVPDPQIDTIRTQAQLRTELPEFAEKQWDQFFGSDLALTLLSTKIHRNRPERDLAMFRRIYFNALAPMVGAVIGPPDKAAMLALTKKDVRKTIDHFFINEKKAQMRFRTLDDIARVFGERARPKTMNDWVKKHLGTRYINSNAAKYTWAGISNKQAWENAVDRFEGQQTPEVVTMANFRQLQDAWFPDPNAGDDSPTEPSEADQSDRPSVPSGRAASPPASMARTPSASTAPPPDDVPQPPSQSDSISRSHRRQRSDSSSRSHRQQQSLSDLSWSEDSSNRGNGVVPRAAPPGNWVYNPHLGVQQPVFRHHVKFVRRPGEFRPREMHYPKWHPARNSLINQRLHQLSVHADPMHGIPGKRTRIGSSIMVRSTADLTEVIIKRGATFAAVRVLVDRAKEQNMQVGTRILIRKTRKKKFTHTVIVSSSDLKHKDADMLTRRIWNESKKQKVSLRLVIKPSKPGGSIYNRISTSFTLL